MTVNVELEESEGAKRRVIPRRNGKVENIPINNDQYDDAHDIVIDKRNINQLLIQIKNTGDTNGLVYQVFGAVEQVDTAPVFDSIFYSPVAKGADRIKPERSTVLTIQDEYSFVMIRVKRQNFTLDTTAEIQITTAVK